MADPSADDEAPVHDLKQAYLLCRTFGHAWSVAGRAQLASGNLWKFVLRCRTCKAEREDTVTSGGGLVERSYGYQDGYLFTSGVHYSKDDYRREVLHRPTTK